MKTTQIVRNNQRIALHQPGGTVIELLSPLSEDAYCVMAGAIPPGASVPLHSHEDAESFYLLSGQTEVLVEGAGGLQWQELRPGDFIHIPGRAKHAWRNSSSETAFTVIACTARLGRALEEMGQATRENGAQSSSPEAMKRLADIALRYGYWLGSPEENAAAGISLPDVHAMRRR